MCSITELKNEIQDILDKKKNINIDDPLYDLLKKEQHSLLDKLQKELYTLHYNNQQSNTSKLNENLYNYNKINDENKSDNTQDVLNEYNLYDSKKVPGYLFFHDHVTSVYNLCPFIKLNESNFEEIENNRIKWLESTKDKGNTYFNLYDIIINEKYIKENLTKKQEIEHDIEDIINITLTTEQKQMYNDALILLYEYNTSKLKSKKVKEKYKQIIYYFSNIYSTSHIHIHEYLSLKFDCEIIINYTDVQLNKSNNDYSFITSNFKEYIERYNEIKTNLSSSIKYVKNTNKHLKNSLHKFLTSKNKENIQYGKYFKKWSTLTFDEQCDRLQSYSKYYIYKREQFCKYDIDQKEKYTNMLYEFLKDSLEQKILKYNLLKWNIKTGIIDSIYMETIITTKDDTVDTITFNLKIKTPINKNSSIKKNISNNNVISIFTPENEKHINEHILNFVIKNKKESNILDTSFLNVCLNNIKSYLKLKKISKNDTETFKKRYNEIYEIVIKNQAN